MKINDIQTYFPGQSYSNAELVSLLQQKDLELSETLVSLGGKHFSEKVRNAPSFFEQLGIGRRNILCDPANPQRWWEQNANSDPFSLEAAKAYEKLMANHDRLGPGDRLIVITNVADTTAPHVGYTTLAHLQRRTPGFIAPSVIALVGEGCSGFISGLREADLYVRGHPGSRVVIVTVEMMATPLLNPWLQPALISHSRAATPGDTPAACSRLTGLGIQRYLFGDGCAAALCAADGEGLEFRQFAKWANLDPDDHHLLEVVGINTRNAVRMPPFGFFQQEPEKLLRRLLKAYIPEARDLLEQLPSAPDHFAIHTGSGKILNYIQQLLGLDDSQMEPSRAVLRSYGNMNATTGAAILASLLRSARTDRVAALFFGVGFAMQLATT